MHIYCISNKINDKKYIGQTKTSINLRWRKHRERALRGEGNTHFYNAIRKYGADAFSIELIETVDDNDLLSEREVFWIEHFDSFCNGYNSTTGGEGGYIRTEEYRKNMAERKRGIPAWNRGIKTGPMSDEAKMNMKVARRKSFDEGQIPWNKGKKGVQDYSYRSKLP